MGELDFSKIFGETATSKASFTDENYLNGWGYLGSTPPPYQLFDYLQSLNDKKSKYLYERFNNYLPLTGGIQTNGTQVVEIRDSLTEKTYPIRFNRPTAKPIFVRVDVYDYAEEVWSSNNVNNIKQAIVDYGSQLSFGEDVIVQRLYGPIYSSTQGIGRIEVQMSTDGVS